MSHAARDEHGGGAAPTLRVACVQLNTRQDVAANLRAALELVEAAADQGARLIALPETWAYKGDREGILATAEVVDGPSNRALADAAARRGVWLLAGSVYEPAPGGLVSNVSALFDPSGELRAAYRKIHLFDAVTATARYEESEEVEAGEELVTADVDTPDGTPVRLGLSICYDLRFPALYSSLALRGAQVLCVPSAFTAYTGAAHWETLLRARAIENGCFVARARPGRGAPAGARLLRPQHDRRPVGRRAGPHRRRRRHLRRRPGPGPTRRGAGAHPRTAAPAAGPLRPLTTRASVRADARHEVGCGGEPPGVAPVLRDERHAVVIAPEHTSGRRIRCEK